MNLSRHFVLDVESDGPCPGFYSMISMAIINVGTMDSIKLETAPLPGAKRIEENAVVSGVSREEHESYFDPISEINRLNKWVKKQVVDRPTIWSDNPAYDWQFLNYYFCYAGLENPFGWSARRIGDLYCGLVKNPYAKWKHLRDTNHSHDPLDDCRGNAEALRKIIKMLKK